MSGSVINKEYRCLSDNLKIYFHKVRHSVKSSVISSNKSCRRSPASALIRSTDTNQTRRHMTPIARTVDTYSENVRNAIALGQKRYIYPTIDSDSVHVPPVIQRKFTVTNELVRLQMLAWSDYVGRSLDVPVSRRQVANGFRGEIDTYVLKDMVYIDSRTDPVSQTRTKARISTDSMRDYVFHVAVEGVVETSTGSSLQRNSSQFMPGVLALDMNQPMHMARPTRAHVLAFFLPRALVESVIPDAESIHGRVMGYTSPIGRLLHKQLMMLCRDLSSMSPSNAEIALRTCARLLMTAFAKQARLSDGTRAAVRAAVYGQIKHYIQANLHRQELGPEEILQAHTVPRPSMYRMFEQDGGLVTYIRHRRLREAADQLIRSPLTPVAQIAQSVGFTSHSDFTRAFHRTYGAAPLEFRAMGLEWPHT
jgi:AraC-like DNA-binding protein